MWLLARMTIRDLMRDRARSLLCVTAMAGSLAIVLAIEGGARTVQGLLHDREGAWLGADLTLIAKEPVEELAGEALVLETVAGISGEALAIKVVDPRRYPLVGRLDTDPSEARLAGDGVVLSEDAAAALRVRVGDRIAVGHASLLYAATIQAEPDRFIGTPSGLPRMILSHANWERAQIGAKASPPLYRYLFRAGTADELERKKSELLRLYPGALVLGRDDRNGETEQVFAASLRYFRAVAAAAVVLGLTAVSLLLRLAGLEEIEKLALLRALGMRGALTVAWSAWRVGLLTAAAIVAAIPLHALLTAWIAQAIGYYSPWAVPRFAGPADAIPLVGAAAAFFLAGMGAAWQTKHVRPSEVWRDAAPRRNVRWRPLLFVFAALAAAGTSMVWVLGRSSVEALGAWSGQADDGILVVGEAPGLSPKLRSEAAWVRVLNAGEGSPTMAMASCDGDPPGVRVESRFAERTGLRPGQEVRLAIGRREAAAPVVAIEAPKGLAAQLAQLYVPCRLLAGAPKFVLQWIPGDSATLRKRVPPGVAAISRAEWEARTRDIVGRVEAVVWLLWGYFAAMAAANVYLTARFLFLSRAREVAIWRVAGAARRTSWLRIWREWWPGLTAAQFLGSLLGSMAAARIAGDFSGAWTWSWNALTVVWVPLLGLGLWAAVLRLALNPVLNRRPLDTLRGRD